MESATSVTFTTAGSAELTLAIQDGTTIYVDSQKYDITGKTSLTVSLGAGNHEIKKGSGSSNLFYIEVKGDGSTPVVTSAPEQGTTAQNPATTQNGGTGAVSGNLKVVKSGGWNEMLYAVLSGVQDADVTAVSYSGKASGSLYLVGRIVAPPVTGAGAYFPFPDNINEGVASTRGGATAWLPKASKNLWTLEGADASPSLTELSGYFADTAYRFFDFGGKRYIAYTRQVSSGDGRLFILEGETTQGWSQILQERNVVYHAAIQNDTEQEGISEEPSPRTSGNSGMDLDVRQVGDDMYIVVVKQNVGLSLFRMMMN
jgi:hypothetical protein